MKIQKLLLEVDAKYSDYIVWFIGTGAFVGSLILSEVEKFQPCLLCWWQRIFMYPIAFIMTVAILRKDKSAFYYVAPLSVVGMCIAFYHSLLQWGVIRETVLDCTAAANVSCTDAQINWFGFITIPFMSLVSFIGINAFVFLRIYLNRKAASK
jgi:disulfide bond formation protein DsbB